MSFNDVEMVNELRQNLVYGPPGKKDKINTMVCVMIVRTLRNCDTNAKRILSESSMAKMKKRLKKLMISTGDPDGVLVIITKDNLSDIVTTVSETLHQRFGSSENMVKAAMKRDEEFDEALIEVLAEQLGVRIPDCHRHDASPDHESDSPFPGFRPTADSGVIFCCLLLRNMINVPEELYEFFPSDVRKMMVSRLCGLMVQQNQMTASHLELQTENLERIAVAISKEIHEAFGSIQKLFKVALLARNSFDVLLLDYLETRMNITRKPENTLARMFGAIDRDLENISRWFHRLRTSRYSGLLW